MKRIAFVVQRYGREVNGGAELYTREIANQLKDQYIVEVLTTCALDHITWANEYPEGTDDIDGVTVRRFRVDRMRDINVFALQNTEMFENHVGDTAKEYQWLEDQGPMCTQLIEYIEENKDRYDVFFFVTYLYYHTVHGLPLVPDKAVLIPTAHDEPYIRLGIFHPVFTMPRAMGFNAEEEKTLVHNLFHNENIPSKVLGMGITLPQGIDPAGFKARHCLDEYLLYVGRIDLGKSCPQMIQAFIKYKDENPGSNLKLVLMGKSSIEIPVHPDVLPLGYVNDEEKFDGMAGAKMLLMPSEMESLSIVVLESLALGVPVVVNGKSEVLRGHCVRSNAGLYYTNYNEFKGTINYLLSKSDIYQIMSENGKSYVKDHYQWSVIVEKLNWLIESATQLK